MKPIVAASLATMSLLVLAGCSTMHDTSSMANKGDVEDSAYVARVEQVARNRGVSVRWVNPPRKHVSNQL
jgi:hypothetical protein